MTYYPPGQYCNARLVKAVARGLACGGLGSKAIVTSLLTADTESQCKREA